MKAKAVYTLVFICMATIFGATIVAADEGSLWIGTATPKLMLVQSSVTSNNSEAFCEKRTEEEILYKRNPLNLFTWIIDKLNPVSGCWYNTTYGAFGSTTQGLYMRIGSKGPVTRIENPNYHQYFPLGNSNRMAGVYNIGYQRYLYIVDDVTKAYELKNNNYYYSYVPVSNAAKVPLIDPTTNTPLRLGHVGVSQNGKWLIVESYVGFIRVNTDTMELLTIEKPLYGYGYGQDPTYSLSISNDGRYAAISGGNVVHQSNFLYDISMCSPANENLLTPATGCGKRDLKADVFTNLSTSQSAGGLVFSDNNESITLDLHENNTWNRYVMTAAGKDYHGLEYLALGDSYSSGEGETDDSYYIRGTNGDGESEPVFMTNIANFPYEIEKCHVSTRSYPYRLAATARLTNLNFKSVACSGSTTNDIVADDSKNNQERYLGKNEQFQALSEVSTIRDIKNIALTNFVPGRAAQIEFVEKYQPRVATIGIGGNDINFRDKIQACVEFWTCDYVGSLRSSSGREVQGLYKTLVETYNKLKNASPTTKFYAIGYPDIISESKTCTTHERLNEVERTYAKEMVQYLNTILKAAADTVGFAYLATEDSLQGNRLCDDVSGEKGVQSLTVGDDVALSTVVVSDKQKYILGFGNESYHPTAIGNQMMADALTKEMGYKNLLAFQPCGSSGGITCPKPISSIAIPAYFTAYDPYIPDESYGVETLNDPQLTINDHSALTPGSILPVDGLRTTQDNIVSDLQPNSTMSVEIRSTPRKIGDLQVDANGKPSGTLQIPSDIEPGYHTIVYKGMNNLGQSVLLYQPIIIYASQDDIDGDGTPNQTDQCQFVALSGIDADKDGIDDGCDGEVYRKPDATAPTVTAKIDKTPNENGWYKEDVTISWNVVDDVDTNISAPSTISVAEEGEHVYTSAPVCDAAGNCAVGSVAVKLDKTAPIVSATTSVQANSNGWFKDNVTVSWHVAENIDDSLIAPQMQTIEAEGANEIKTDDVCDRAGNCTQGSVTIKLDKTSPLVSGSIASQPNAADWYKAPQSISWVVRDALDSNIVQLAPTMTTHEGEYTYMSDVVCDQADNCTVGMMNVKLDTVAPRLSEMAFTNNPKKATEVTEFSVTSVETTSGLARGEYYIGDNDPGYGNGAVLQQDGLTLKTTAGTNYATGVYKLTARTQDQAGNWSDGTTGYLVVYDPSSGLKVRGKRTILLPQSTGLPWVENSTAAVFGLSAKYGSDGTLSKQSDLQLSYKTGTSCNNTKLAQNCHSFDLNAMSFEWLTVGGQNQSLASFHAKAIVKLDASSEQVMVTGEVVDGSRLGSTAADMIQLKIYRSQYNPFMVTPDYVIGPTEIERGNIKISF